MFRANCYMNAKPILPSNSALLTNLKLRQLRQLRDENARLKRLVADLRLDRHILQEVLKKKT